jgi:Tfp pilus assembly protein PilZ
MQRGIKPITIGILSSDKNEEKALREAAVPLNADLYFAPTVQHLRSFLLEQSSSGILLSLPSLMGIEPSGRGFIQTLEQIYPVARIRLDKAKESFALITSRNEHVETLEDFIKICSVFTARGLRHSERLVKTLNVLISAFPEMTHATNAFTVNVSMRGCFLHTPFEWEPGDIVYMKILELHDEHMIEGRVVRSVKWGTPFSVPGIGVQFVNIDSEFDEKLKRVLYFLPPGHPARKDP